MLGAPGAPEPGGHKQTRHGRLCSAGGEVDGKPCGCGWRARGRAALGRMVVMSVGFALPALAPGRAGPPLGIWVADETHSRSLRRERMRALAAVLRPNPGSRKQWLAGASAAREGLPGRVHRRLGYAVMGKCGQNPAECSTALAALAAHPTPSGPPVLLRCRAALHSPALARLACFAG